MESSLIKMCLNELSGYTSAEKIEIDSESSIRQMLRPRDPQAHKKCFGHALLYAGSMGMAGAAVLSAKACMRSGAGLLTVCSPLYNNAILQTTVPEAMTITPKEVSLTDFSTSRFNAIGAGPGLGCGEDRTRLLAILTKSAKLPIVLDADALNIIAKNPKMMEYLPQTTILTPHVGELARLTGTSFSNRTDIVTKALELALKHNVTVIVKGAPTVTVSPDGKLFINTTGNAGMATAGSGDVLTGIVLAMITQSYPGTEASRIATYIHGLAGDIAARKFSQTAMTSADIADCLPEAWLKMTMEL